MRLYDLISSPLYNEDMLLVVLVVSMIVFLFGIGKAYNLAPDSKVYPVKLSELPPEVREEVMDAYDRESK